MREFNLELMFCPNCGKENPDDNKFCKNCGTAIVISSQKKTYSYRFFPNAVFIGLGLVILISLYLMPIDVVISGYGTMTVAKYVSICENPSGELVYQCSKLMSWILYGGWIVGLSFVVTGLFYRIKE